MNLRFSKSTGQVWLALSLMLALVMHLISMPVSAQIEDVDVPLPIIEEASIELSNARALEMLEMMTLIDTNEGRLDFEMYAQDHQDEARRLQDVHDLLIPLLGREYRFLSATEPVVEVVTDEILVEQVDVNDESVDELTLDQPTFADLVQRIESVITLESTLLALQERVIDLNEALVDHPAAAGLLVAEAYKEALGSFLALFTSNENPNLLPALSEWQLDSVLTNFWIHQGQAIKQLMLALEQIPSEDFLFLTAKLDQDRLLLDTIANSHQDEAALSQLLEQESLALWDQYQFDDIGELNDSVALLSDSFERIAHLSRVTNQLYPVWEIKAGFLDVLSIDPANLEAVSNAYEYLIDVNDASVIDASEFFDQYQLLERVGEAVDTLGSESLFDHLTQISDSFGLAIQLQDRLQELIDARILEQASEEIEEELLEEEIESEVAEEGVTEQEVSEEIIEEELDDAELPEEALDEDVIEEDLTDDILEESVITEEVVDELAEDDAEEEVLEEPIDEPVDGEVVEQVVLEPTEDVSLELEVVDELSDVIEIITDEVFTDEDILLSETLELEPLEEVVEDDAQEPATEELSEEVIEEVPAEELSEDEVVEEVIEETTEELETDEVEEGVIEEVEEEIIEEVEEVEQPDVIDDESTVEELADELIQDESIVEEEEVLAEENSEEVVDEISEESDVAEELTEDVSSDDSLEEIVEEEIEEPADEELPEDPAEETETDEAEEQVVEEEIEEATDEVEIVEEEVTEDVSSDDSLEEIIEDLIEEVVVVSFFERVLNFIETEIEAYQFVFGHPYLIQTDRAITEFERLTVYGLLTQQVYNQIVAVDISAEEFIGVLAELALNADQFDEWYGYLTHTTVDLSYQPVSPALFGLNGVIRFGEDCSVLSDADSCLRLSANLSTRHIAGVPLVNKQILDEIDVELDRLMVRYLNDQQRTVSIGDLIIGHGELPAEDLAADLSDDVVEELEEVEEVVEEVPVEELIDETTDEIDEEIVEEIEGEMVESDIEQQVTMSHLEVQDNLNQRFIIYESADHRLNLVRDVTLQPTELDPYRLRDTYIYNYGEGIEEELIRFENTVLHLRDDGSVIGFYLNNDQLADAELVQALHESGLDALEADSLPSVDFVLSAPLAIDTNGQLIDSVELSIEGDFFNQIRLIVNTASYPMALQTVLTLTGTDLLSPEEVRPSGDDKPILTEEELLEEELVEEVVIDEEVTEFEVDVEEISEAIEEVTGTDEIILFDITVPSTPSIECSDFETGVFNNKVETTCIWTDTTGPSEGLTTYCIDHSNECLPDQALDERLLDLVLSEHQTYLRVQNQDEGGFSNIATFELLVNQPPQITVLPSDGGSNASNPTRAGETVTFSMTASDADLDDYTLLICRTSSEPLYVDGTIVCGGGDQNQLCRSAKVASGQSASCDYSTADETVRNLIWYAFACDDFDSFALCSESSQGEGIKGSPVYIQHPATFGAVNVTDIDGGVPEFGEPLRFTVPAGQIIDVPSERFATLYICSDETTGFDYANNRCTGGRLICASDSTDPANDISCAEDDELLIRLPANAGEQQFKAYIEYGQSGLVDGIHEQRFELSDSEPTLIDYVNEGAIVIAPGSFSTVNFSATLQDLNGTDDVKSVRGVFFDDESVFSDCEENRNDCYHDFDCDLVAVDDLTVQADCAVDVYYNANAATSWKVDITVVDVNDNEFDLLPSESSRTVPALAAINQTEISIPYPNALPGTTTDAVAVMLTNLGNQVVDVLVDGTDLVGENYLLPRALQKFSLEPDFDYELDGIELIQSAQSDGGADVGCLDVSLPVHSDPLLETDTVSVYWRIAVPEGQKADDYKGSVFFNHASDSCGQ